tara:strand:+ start:523 stop:984 length:462 start_codon:yes stop_codon:yes gene_type:complete
MAKTYVVERSQIINAAPEALFEKIANLRNWASWSPWEKLDSNMDKTFDGEDGVVGSTYAWKGNKKVGEGKMTLAKLEGGDAVTVELAFVKPFKALSSSRFSLTPEGSGTKIVWTMTGQHNWLSKVMGVFMNMDKMLGKDFDEGLNNLKKLVEA